MRLAILLILPLAALTFIYQDTYSRPFTPRRPYEPPYTDRHCSKNIVGRDPSVTGPEGSGVRVEVIRQISEYARFIIKVETRGQELHYGTIETPGLGIYSYIPNNPEYFQPTPGETKTIRVALFWAGSDGQIVLRPRAKFICSYTSEADEVHFYANDGPWDHVHYVVRLTWYQ